MWKARKPPVLVLPIWGSSLVSGIKCTSVPPLMCANNLWLSWEPVNPSADVLIGLYNEPRLNSVLPEKAIAPIVEPDISSVPSAPPISLFPKCNSPGKLPVIFTKEPPFNVSPLLAKKLPGECPPSPTPTPLAEFKWISWDFISIWSFVKSYIR